MHWSCHNPTYQQASSSVTPLGIGHWIQKRLNTIDHTSLALEQCNTKWSTILALLLHIQHQFITRTCLFLILSTAKICTKAAVHKKNATLDGTLGLQILLQGKHTLPCGARALKLDLTSDLLCLEGVQHNLSSSQPIA